jgi:hypothetical protein
MRRLLNGPGPVAKPAGAVATGAFVVGGLLVIWLSYIHFHLWQSVGYRHIPTIGPLFLVQSIVGLVLGLAVIAIRRIWVAIVGAGFAVATMGGFLISVEHGLFGFTDSWSAPFADVAFAVEIATVVVLAIAVVACLAPSAQAGRTGSTPAASPSPSA